MATPRQAAAAAAAAAKAAEKAESTGLGASFKRKGDNGATGVGEGRKKVRGVTSVCVACRSIVAICCC